MLSEKLPDLFESENYRVFLKRYIEIKDINISDFARSVGCHRGFPADVINGRRRLTNKSYYLFEKAFKLPNSYKNFFQLLVAQEEKDIFINIDPETIHLKIDQIKNNLILKKSNRYQSKKTDTNDEFQNVIDSQYSFLVFSAVGEPTTGATYDQIQMRTRLSSDPLKKTLKILVKSGLLKFENDRYFPKDQHVHFQFKNTSEMLVKLFTNGAKAAEKRVTQILPNSDELFFVSQFCIKENQMPFLKKELKEVILKFVDSSIVNDGDRVVRLLTALHF